MPEAGTSFISASWIKPLWKLLRSIRGEREKEIQKIKNTFTDPFDLARYYIEPHCQHHNPADHLEDIEPRSAVKSPIFSTINDFLQGEYAATRTGKSQFFILSDAGMGKSSLLVMLKLAHLTRFWPSRYHCALLKLGRETLTEIKAITNAGDTILLLDALDEDPLAWGDVQPRILELLTATSSFRRVIISCRTQFFPKGGADPFANGGRIVLGGFTCPMVFLSLFDSKQVEAYLDKRYPRKWYKWWKIPEKREAATALVTKMKDLSCRPMLLAHVEDLVDSEIKDWTEYSVYRALVKAWLLREERKLLAIGHSVDNESLFGACKIVAGEMATAGSRFISEERLQELMGTNPSLKDLMQISFGGRSLLNRNSDGAYRFSHFSIQEFVEAAHLLSTRSPSNPTEPLVIPGNISHKLLDFIFAGQKEMRLSRGMDFTGVTLTGFDFTDRYLENSSFKNASLEGASFIRANCKNANFEGATLRGSIFRGADLEGANLKNTEIDTIDFNGANLKSAKLNFPLVGHPFRLDLSPTEAIDFLPLFALNIPEESSYTWISQKPLSGAAILSLLRPVSDLDNKTPYSGRIDSLTAAGICRAVQHTIASELPYQNGARIVVRPPTGRDLEAASKLNSSEQTRFKEWTYDSFRNAENRDVTGDLFVLRLVMDIALRGPTSFDARR